MCSAYSLGSLIIIFLRDLIWRVSAYSTPANVASVYYSSTDNPLALDATLGQCTWYVYGRIQETGLITYQKTLKHVKYRRCAHFFDMAATLVFRC